MRNLAGVWSKLRTVGTRSLARQSSRRLAAVLLFCGAFVFMGLFVAGDWNSLVSFPWQLRWERLAALVILHLLASTSLFLAWHLMMRRLFGRIEWKGEFRVYSLSILARRIPSPIWYIGGRVYLYQQMSVPAPVVLSATGLEALLIGVGGIVCYVLLLPGYSYSQPWLWLPLLIAWVVLVSVLLIRPNLLIEVTNRVLRWVKRPHLQVSIARSDLATWALVYLSTWFLDGLGLYFAVTALVPDPLRVVDVIGVSTVSALVALATLILPGGLGLKELTMGALLSQWIPVSTGLVISIFYRVAQTVIEGAWVLIALWLGRTRPGAIAAPDARK